MVEKRLLTKAERYANAQANRLAAREGRLDMDLEKHLVGMSVQQQVALRSSVLGANADWRDDNGIDDHTSRPCNDSVLTRDITPILLARTLRGTQTVYTPTLCGNPDTERRTGAPTILPDVMNPRVGTYDMAPEQSPLARPCGLDGSLFAARTGVTSAVLLSQQRNVNLPTEPETIRDNGGAIPPVPEPGLLRTTAPYFTGSVQQGVADLWSACMATEDETAEATLDRAMLWAAASAVEPPVPSMCNRRMMTQYGLLVEGDVPSDKVVDKATTVIKTHAHQERQQQGGSSRTVINTERIHRRTYSLSSRAAEFGNKIKHDYKRIVGVLENGATNRKWSIAISRWILSQDQLPSLITKWIEGLKKDKTLQPRDVKTRSRQILATLKLWAAQEDDLKEFEPSTDAKKPKDTDGTVIDEPVTSGQDLGVSFVGTLSFSRMAADLQARAICPFCVYASLAGIDGYKATAINEDAYQWKIPDEMFDEYIRTRLIVTKGGNGWVEACARAHNREMHASNGNIDQVTNFTSREPLVALERAQLWDSPTIQVYDGPEVPVLVNKAMEALPKIYYTDRTLRGTQAPTNVGTLYQYVCERGALQEALDARLNEELRGRPQGGAEEGLEGGPELRPVNRNLPGPSGTAALIVDRNNPDNSTTGDDSDASASAGSEGTIERVIRREFDEAHENVNRAIAPRAVAARRRAVNEVFSSTARRLAAFLRNRREKTARPVRASNTMVIIREEEGDGALPPLDPAAAQMEMALQTQRLRWVAIGFDPAHNHGKLVAAPILVDTLDAATDPAPNKPGVINGAKSTATYGFMSNCTSIAAAVAAEVAHGRTDWRVMGMKVALYDELRERRISQPSGVEWAIVYCNTLGTNISYLIQFVSIAILL